MMKNGNADGLNKTIKSNNILAGVKCCRIPLHERRMKKQNS
jgi:hypothetical protein